MHRFRQTNGCECHGGCHNVKCVPVLHARESSARNAYYACGITMKVIRTHPSVLQLDYLVSLGVHVNGLKNCVSLLEYAMYDKHVSTVSYLIRNTDVHIHKYYLSTQPDNLKVFVCIFYGLLKQGRADVMPAIDHYAMTNLSDPRPLSMILTFFGLTINNVVYILSPYHDEHKVIDYFPRMLYSFIHKLRISFSCYTVK